jgi:hypothetical protein
MRLYLTDAQIPELREFQPDARRALRQCAFQQMFAHQRWLRWIPNGLCCTGALIGLLTFGFLPRTLYSWSDMAHMLVPTGYMLFLATVGGCVGAQLLTHRARHYLRRLITSDADKHASSV